MAGSVGKECPSHILAHLTSRLPRGYQKGTIFGSVGAGGVMDIQDLTIASLQDPFSGFLVGEQQSGGPPAVSRSALLVLTCSSGVSGSFQGVWSSSC